MPDINPQFTPGPWRALTTTCEDDLEVFGPGDEEICVCVHPMHSGIGHEQFEANAKLIAAAPEMYAALEAVLESDMAMREEDEGRQSSTLNLVRDCLAKARGEADRELR